MNDYSLFAMEWSGSAQRTLTFSRPNWTTFRGFGGGITAGGALQTYMFGATRSGETLTWVEAGYWSMGPSASTVTRGRIALVATVIWGVA